MQNRCVRRLAVTLTRNALMAVGATTVASLLMLTGCSSGVPHVGEPDTDEKKDEVPMDAPVCLVTEGNPDVIPEAVDSVWWQEGGTMRCVASTPPPAGCGDSAFAPTRDEAVALAAGRLLPGAFEMLERRGASLSPVRQEETADGFAVAVARGESSEFPRIAIREAVVESCETPEGGEHWRARLFAEYPVGVLKGDATHAQWEERRLRREMEMRIASADGLFADGRWLEAVLQMKSAHRLLGRLGAGEVQTDLGARLLSDFQDSEGALAPRFVSLRGRDPLVVPAGGREPVRYRLEYRLGDAWVAASGVPVEIEGGNLVRPTAGAMETDASGEIAFELVAGAEEGDDHFRMTARVFPRMKTLLPHGSVDQPDVAAVIVQNVIVLSKREATVCVEIDAEHETCSERVREALSNGLAALGSALVDCGPDADLVVSVDVSVSTQEVHGSWLARATCEIRVFDQRLADETGSTVFEVTESLESSARDAEQLALRETGRLITVYLEPRLAER